MEYLILQNPGHNRVYFKQADQMALAELELACKRLQPNCSDLSITHIADVQYLSFKTDTPIGPDDLALLSRLSFTYALFEKVEAGENLLLKPHTHTRASWLDSKLTTIQKYSGKTNELFTRLMINVGLLSSRFDYSESIQLLDPIAGRGTTLFEGLLQGFNASGIEIEGGAVHQTVTFFKKYLEQEKIKHRYDKRQIAGGPKNDRTLNHEFTFAPDKDSFKTGDSMLQLNLLAGDTKDTLKFYKKPRFHLIVGDLPYGIFHGNKQGQETKGKTRNPAELMRESLEAWKAVLLSGGCMVLAWNSNVADKKHMETLIKNAGLTCINESPYDKFEHRVDQAIKRDMVVALKE